MLLIIAICVSKRSLRHNDWWHCWWLFQNQRKADRAGIWSPRCGMYRSLHLNPAQKIYFHALAVHFRYIHVIFAMLGRIPFTITLMFHTLNCKNYKTFWKETAKLAASSLMNLDNFSFAQRRNTHLERSITMLLRRSVISSISIWLRFAVKCFFRTIHC